MPFPSAAHSARCRGSATGDHIRGWATALGTVGAALAAGYAALHREDLPKRQAGLQEESERAPPARAGRGPARRSRLICRRPEVVGQRGASGLDRVRTLVAEHLIKRLPLDDRPLLYAVLHALKCVTCDPRAGAVLQGP